LEKMKKRKLLWRFRHGWRYFSSLEKCKEYVFSFLLWTFSLYVREKSFSCASSTLIST
jgi:hypothetical protein